VAYFDYERKTYKKGLKLLAWNDVELTPRGNQRLRYEMIMDECKVSQFSSAIVLTLLFLDLITPFSFIKRNNFTNISLKILHFIFHFYK